MLFSFPKAVMETHGPGGAGVDAHPAADTLGMIWCFRHVYIHLADLGAFPAGNAFMLVYLHLKEGDPVEQRIECPQRAEPFAERTVEYDTQYNHRQQNAELPRKQLAQRRADAGIGEGERDRALQHALRAEVLAEEGVAHAHIVHEERRQQKDHHQQNGILEVRQGLQLPCGELLRGNFMQQILKPPEGTQKSADKPSQKNSQQDEEAGDIIGKAEL